MKTTPPCFGCVLRRFVAAAISFTLALAGGMHATAATIYWEGVSGTASWGLTGNWSTSSSATTPNPAAVPGASDDVIFNISTANNNTTITLNDNRAAQSLTFVNTGSTIFRGNTSGTTTARTLTTGTGGITAAPGAGAVLFTDSFTGSDGRVNLTLAGSQSITNNSSSSISIGTSSGTGLLAGTGSPTLTNTGTGTGRVLMFVSIDSTVSKIVQDSATSELWLRAPNASFTGDVEIRKGTLNIGSNNGNLGTGGTLFLGNPAGGSDAATLSVFDGGTRTYANPIVLGPTTGPLTIFLRDDDGANPNSHIFTGGITGTNNLILENRADGSDKDDRLTFSTGAINIVGTITHIGDAEGDLTINSVIGTNVTGVTQNSATSRMVLGGTNTYLSTTTVQSGTLALASTGSIDSSPTIDVQSGAFFDVALKPGYTVGASQTLMGKGTVIGTTSIDGTLAPGLGAGTLTFTNNLAMASTSILSFELNPFDTTVGSNINDLAIVNGNLTLAGLLNITPTVSDFSTVTSGTWRLFNYDGTLTDNELTLNSMPVLPAGYSWTLDTATPNQVNLTIVPEPGTALLGGLGLLALLRCRRRR
jgi:hypothetical protein